MASEQTPASLNTARVIASGLIAGPCLIWLTALFMVVRFGPPTPLPASTVLLLFELWLALAVAALVSSWIFRGRALRVVERASNTSDPAEADRALSEIQTFLIISWALVEAAALFSGILFLMTGSARIALLGLVVLVIGMLGSFPRAAWFEPLQRVRDGSARRP